MKGMNKESVRKILLQFSIITFILMLFLLATANASAQESVMRRYALYIGSNYGGRDRVTLSYAVTDARTVSEVMQQLGGVMPADGIILTDPSPALVRDTITEIGKKVKADETVKRSEFFFYYSGHSDEKGLLLGDNVYKYEDLKESLNSVGADVNIAVLDSCSSGAFTRMKGGVRRSPFLSDESVDASGHAFLTSSSEDEAAQESDDIGASFFTHYLVTALRGAGDSTLDGTVSLNEAYSYASSETLARTEDTYAGPQHPSYDIQLAGTGDLILTDLREVSEQIVFDKDLRGRIFMRDSAGRLVVELKKIEGTPLAVSISPGRYSMILDDGDQLLSADLMLTGGSRVLVQRDEFYPVPRSFNTARGGTIVELPEGSDDSVTAESRGIDDTAAELDVIAERARKRALEAAAASSGKKDEVSADYSFSEDEQPYYKEQYEDEQDEEEKSLPSGSDNGFNFGLAASAENLDGIQLGLISAGVDGTLDGVQMASIFCDVSGDMDGVQLAGIYNSVDGDVDGAQISGIWNAADGDLSGAQVAGIWNSADNAAFCQTAGIFNSAGGDLMGVQVGGIFNIVGGEVVGGQLSGLFNTSGDVTGVQIAGIFNTAEDVKGVQIGLFNFGGEVYGMQIGLVNISDELYGVPLGLINISGNGLNDFSGWRDDRGFLNAGYQLGTSTVYTFINIGIPEDDSDRAATAGLGMGLELGDDFIFADLDIYAKAYEEGTGTFASNMQSIFTGRADYFPAIRLSGGFELFGFLGVFAGLNLDCRIEGSYGSYSFNIGSRAAASYDVTPFTINFGDYGVMDMYPSWFFGIRL